MGQATSMRKVGVAAFIGALVEWHDHFLYGLAAGVVFNQLFFPSENPLVPPPQSYTTTRRYRSWFSSLHVPRTSECQ
jgi:MHS family shikimate/dehydroshikimate transporter-like MFS transporter